MVTFMGILRCYGQLLRKFIQTFGHDLGYKVLAERNPCVDF